MGHTSQVDRLLIRTAAGQASIGNNDGHITGSAPTVTGRANPIRGHVVVTDTNPRRSRRPAVPYSQSGNRAPGVPSNAGSTTPLRRACRAPSEEDELAAWPVRSVAYVRNFEPRVDERVLELGPLAEAQSRD
jgi:hypothetical protein